MASLLKIGFLGAGKMATALAKGFLKAEMVLPESLIASDPVEAARAAFSKETKGRAATSNIEVVHHAEVLVLAVKPDQVTDVLAEVRSSVTERHLLISIAAGVPLARLESLLVSSARIVRVMPNTPALIGASASAYAMGKAAREEDAVLTQRLLSAVGIAFAVKESLLDAVTGLSGSGPAYAFLMLEALSDAGVAVGLPREVATRLAAQTMMGSARLLLESGLHPAVLRDMVTSPGGTTIEGLHELEKGGVRGALINAVRAATEKSKKLGQADPKGS
jgi:pyrroline-5-carboxylate reductase